MPYYAGTFTRGRSRGGKKSAALLRGDVHVISRARKRGLNTTFVSIDQGGEFDLRQEKRSLEVCFEGTIFAARARLSGGAQEGHLWRRHVRDAGVEECTGRDVGGGRYLPEQRQKYASQLGSNVDVGPWLSKGWPRRTAPISRARPAFQGRGIGGQHFKFLDDRE